MRIFSEPELGNVLEVRLQELRREVYNEAKNRLLNMHETTYVEYLVSKYQVEPLVIHLDQISISSCEVMIPAKRFPWNFNIRKGEAYPKQVVAYHIPFSGEADLLRYVPSP
jgi:hypothetical protein